MNAPNAASTTAIAPVNASVIRRRIGRRLTSTAAVLAQAVPGASHRFDRADTERLVDLRPQEAHVGVDDVGAVLVLVVPRVLQELEAAHDRAPDFA